MINGWVKDFLRQVAAVELKDEPDMRLVNAEATLPAIVLHFRRGAICSLNLSTSNGADGRTKTFVCCGWSPDDALPEELQLIERMLSDLIGSKPERRSGGPVEDLEEVKAQGEFWLAGKPPE